MCHVNRNKVIISKLTDIEFTWIFQQPYQKASILLVTPRVNRLFLTTMACSPQKATTLAQELHPETLS